MPTDFFSFNFIDVKGLPFQFGIKIFSRFEIADLANGSSYFLLLYSKKEDFWKGPTFKICNCKHTEGYPTKLKWQALDIYETE